MQLWGYWCKLNSPSQVRNTCAPAYQAREELQLSLTEQACDDAICT